MAANGSENVAGWESRVEPQENILVDRNEEQRKELPRNRHLASESVSQHWPAIILFTVEEGLVSTFASEVCCKARRPDERKEEHRI